MHSTTAYVNLKVESLKKGTKKVLIAVMISHPYMINGNKKLVRIFEITNPG